MRLFQIVSVGLVFLAPNLQAIAQELSDYAEMQSCGKDVVDVINSGHRNCELVNPDPQKDYSVAVSSQDRELYIFAAGGAFRGLLPGPKDTSGTQTYQVDLPADIYGQKKRLCINYEYGLFSERSPSQKFVSPNESCGSTAKVVEQIASASSSDDKVKGVLAQKISSCTNAFRTAYENAGYKKDDAKKRELAERWQSRRNADGCGATSSKYYSPTIMKSPEKLSDEVDQYLEKNPPPKKVDSPKASAAEAGTTSSIEGQTASPTNAEDSAADLGDKQKAKASEADKKKENEICFNDAKGFEEAKSKMPKAVQEIPMHFSLSVAMGIGKAAIRVEILNDRLVMTTDKLVYRDYQHDERVIKKICLDSKKPSNLKIYLSGESGAASEDSRVIRIDGNKMKTVVDDTVREFDIDYAKYESILKSINDNRPKETLANQNEGKK